MSFCPKRKTSIKIMQFLKSSQLCLATKFTVPGHHWLEKCVGKWSYPCLKVRALLFNGDWVGVSDCRDILTYNSHFAYGFMIIYYMPILHIWLQCRFYSLPAKTMHHSSQENSYLTCLPFQASYRVLRKVCAFVPGKINERLLENLWTSWKSRLGGKSLGSWK